MSDMLCWSANGEHRHLKMEFYKNKRTFSKIQLSFLRPSNNNCFVDIINYLGPGTTYEKWVKAYSCSVEKSLFPFEWFDSPEEPNFLADLSAVASLWHSCVDKARVSGHVQIIYNRLSRPRYRTF